MIAFRRNLAILGVSVFSLIVLAFEVSNLMRAFAIRRLPPQERAIHSIYAQLQTIRGERRPRYFLPTGEELELLKTLRGDIMGDGKEEIILQYRLLLPSSPGEERRFDVGIAILDDGYRPLWNFLVHERVSWEKGRVDVFTTPLDDRGRVGLFVDYTTATETFATTDRALFLWDGGLREVWRKTIYTMEEGECGVSVDTKDLDGDGIYEIVTEGWCGGGGRPEPFRVYSFREKGEYEENIPLTRANLPFRRIDPTTVDLSPYVPPQMRSYRRFTGDIDNDGEDEIVVTLAKPEDVGAKDAMILRWNGRSFDTWRVNTGGYIGLNATFRNINWFPGDELILRSFDPDSGRHFLKVLGWVDGDVKTLLEGEGEAELIEVEENICDIRLKSGQGVEVYRWLGDRYVPSSQWRGEF
ncbi:MAG: hypothetical protein ACUVXI_07970 [bacterium]